MYKYKIGRIKVLFIYGWTKKFKVFKLNIFIRLSGQTLKTKQSFVTSKNYLEELNIITSFPYFITVFVVLCDFCFILYNTYIKSFWQLKSSCTKVSSSTRRNVKSNNWIN